MTHTIVQLTFHCINFYTWHYKQKDEKPTWSQQ